MIVLLSPAKRMRQQPPIEGSAYRLPTFHEKTLPIIKKLASLSRPKLKALMGTSDALVEANRDNIHQYAADGIREEGTPAIHAFNGEVYLGVDSDHLEEDDLVWADDHVRILSGLYGYLRPLDIIQPYRLEMGSKLKVGRRANLYAYWGEDVTEQLASDLDHHEDDTIINLASKEYVSVINTSYADERMINIHFKELRDGKLKSIQTHMKRARGIMTRQIILERITQADDIKDLEVHGYRYSEEHSTDQDWYFIK